MFSLRMLLAVVTLSAVYIAAMAYRTALWDGMILALTYVIYAAAITAAIVSNHRRTFFVAFAIFGMAYGYFMRLDVGERMVTQLVLNELARNTSDDLARIVNEREENVRYSVRGSAEFDRFISIGHSLFAVMISCLAGAVAQALATRKEHTIIRRLPGSGGS